MTDLRTEELDYALPPRLVATRPAEPRDAARLLVHHVGAGRTEHRVVADLPEYLAAGDLAVCNTTSVAPARLLARRADSGGRVEGLYLERRGDDWLVMLRSNGRLAPGVRLVLLDPVGNETGRELELIGRDGAEWIVRPPAGVSHGDLLDAVGSTPLPPYIRKARGDERIEDARDRAWYQTVYADDDRRESVAAPTAGLHFTPGLLSAIEARGVERVPVVLHVGPGTFRPIAADTIAAHAMHRERFEVPAATLARLAAHRASGGRGRLVAIGTTTVRCLESLPDPLPPADRPFAGSTDLLIAPPWSFRWTDALLTNFHLPRSTLLALVAALVGLDRLLAIYREAVEREYRFYSYGDAMLILP